MQMIAESTCTHLVLAVAFSASEKGRGGMSQDPGGAYFTVICYYLIDDPQQKILNLSGCID